MSGVEVEAIEGEFTEMDGPGGDGGEDGVTLVEEGIQGTPQAIVVEAVGGDVPEEGGTSVFGPGGGVDQGGGLAQPGGEQETQDTPGGEGELRVGRQMA